MTNSQLLNVTDVSIVYEVIIVKITFPTVQKHAQSQKITLEQRPINFVLTLFC